MEEAGEAAQAVAGVVVTATLAYADEATLLNITSRVTRVTPQDDITMDPRYRA